MTTDQPGSVPSATTPITNTRLNLSIDELLTTTRAVRKRLDLEKPVPRHLLTECLELAVQAPTGSNAQGWQWVFVEDAGKRAAIAEVYRGNADRYADMPRPSFPAGDLRAGQIEQMLDSALYLTDHLHEVPVLLVPCLRGRAERAPMGSVSFWASLLPAVWSFNLALRSRGLGSAWTTLHLMGDGEERVADILGIPYQRYSQGGLFPIAYTKGTHFRPAKRLPVEQIVHFDHW